MNHIYQVDEFINIVSKLKFISKVQIGEKIDTQSLTISYPNFYTKLYRSLFSRGECRNTTFEFMNNTIDSAFELINKYISTEKCDSYENNVYYSKIKEIIDSLESSRDGMINIIETYQNDRMYVSKIDTLIKSMNVKINYIKQKNAN